MENPDLLFELGTEELPPKSLQTLSASLTRALVSELETAKLVHGEVIAYAAPRRLAVLVKNVPSRQADQTITRTGPAINAAFDAGGNPTKAAEGFARSCGVSVDDVSRVNDKGVEKLYFELQQTGKTLSELLPDMIERSLEQLPISKKMRWGDNTYQFVRPVQWVVLLHGSQVIDASIMGQAAGNVTRGHRFHAPKDIQIDMASDYEVAMREQGHVEPVFEKRRASIQRQIEVAVAELNGHAVLDKALLDEVTALVEYPVAVVGQFDERFLAVPKEALITTMQDNQKYFAVMDAAGELLPNFITISNIKSKDVKQVSEGNERVIRPRFADAEFFFEQDKKRPLEDNNQRLGSIVFQKDLGSVLEKSQRVSKLAEIIAESVGANPEHAARAGHLCKADLVSNMVLEFSSMQGIAGRYYALHDGEADAVAHAIEQHYWPKYSGALLPESGVAQCVALADKLDTLAGIWSVGLKPTGSKDSYALRRAALGILRILIEFELPLSLDDLIQGALVLQPVKTDGVAQEIKAFFAERLRVYAKDNGFSAEQIQAVEAVEPKTPSDFMNRLKAVSAFLEQSHAQSLIGANKRIQNIFKNVPQPYPEAIDSTLLSSPQEKALAELLTKLTIETQNELNDGNYAAVLKQLADLLEPIDAFFEHVMVFAEDDALQKNRIALLVQAHRLFLGVADFFKLLD